MGFLDRKEAIRSFVRENLSLFKGPFSESEYRDRKRQFFVNKLRNEVGNPRDSEIVQEIVEYLIEIQYLRSEQDLDRLLRHPFLKEKLFRAEEYRERLREHPESIDEFDPSKIRDAEFAKSYRDKVKKEVIEQERESILQGVESTLFPSVLDAADSKEPELKPSPAETPLLWWQELNLESDPFPSEEGLADISDQYYDEIVCRTEIFGKYLELLSMSPGEVLKNALFFGDFGTGKTTFFDYLRKVVISKSSIHPVYVQLLAESDPYALLAKFKVKFLEELKSVFRLLEKRPPEVEFEPYDPDPLSTQIYQVSRQIADVSHCEGFVVFLDDLHKLEFGQMGPKIFWAIITLLSSLQVFKAEFSRKTSLKLAFYVAAVPAWENKLRTSSALSGSFSRYERMPAVTIQDASEMLNRRFAAFAQNKQNPPKIDADLVRRVYNRSTEANESITWRTFIKSLVYDELQQKHFNMLQSSPLSISEEKKTAIREIIESDPAVKGQINSLLYGPIESAENRLECLKLLIDIHLKGSIPEKTLSSLPGDSRYYYERLNSARLIRKRLINGQQVYTISPELRSMNDRVAEKFSLSLEDYLIPIYGTRQLVTSKGEKIVVELNQLEELARRVANPATKTTLREAASNHSQVLARLSDFGQPLDRKPVNFATQSIINLTRAWVLVEESQEPGQEPRTLEEAQEFWTENWWLPSALTEFFKATGNELLSDRELRYALRYYEQAFAAIVAQLSRLNESSKFLFLPRSKLTRAEMETLARCREDFLNGKYMQAMKECTNLVETRLRTFCHNIFSLLYGGPEKRIRRIDDKTAEYVRSTKQKHGYAETNEFEYLNRGQYKNFIAGTDPHGESNWREIFQYVYSPWKEATVLDFLDRFAETNVKVSHVVSGAFRAQDSSEMHRYLGDCVTFLASMNTSYERLVSGWYHHERVEGELRNAHYFCLHGFPGYKPALTPIFIPREKGDQLLREFQSKIGVNPIVDLSDSQYVRTIFNCEYRQFLAFLAAVLQLSSSNTGDMPVKVVASKWFGSEAKLEFSKTK